MMDNTSPSTLYSIPIGPQLTLSRSGAKEIGMKTRTAILVICLTANLVNIARAQTVHDKAGNAYTCRTKDAIYEKVGALHKYDIAKAKQAGERHPANHKVICIDLLNKNTINWSWRGAHQVKVSFFPMTNDSMASGTCWNSTNPFPKMKQDSGSSDTLQSGEADETYQFCAYKLQFESSAGSYDPHIIITGSSGALEDFLKQRRDFLNDLIADLEKKKK
jgi:hypothetical protein